MDSVVVLADRASFPDLSIPVDLKFHTADSNQLFIANRGRNGTLVIRDVGTAGAYSRVWQDRAEYHYNAHIAALSFDNLGKTLITCQNVKNDYYGMHKPNYFMGPTIYEMYPVGSLYGRPNDPVASKTPAGGLCDKDGFPHCYLTHSDMLHEAPMCMGTVHDPGASTSGGFHQGVLKSGHVYFYSDGLHGELMRYDAESLHGPGSLDHRTANIRRYMDVRLKPVEDIPGHMVLDNSTRILYVADTGNGRVIRVDADGGEFKRVAQCVPDECYAAHEGFQESFCKDSYCDGGPCMHQDGYGCYNTFTEMADIFEYELWTCSTQDTAFINNLHKPSGLVLGNGRLYVSDYATGNVHIYDLAGTELEILPVSYPGLAGLEFKCTDASTCNLYFANAWTEQIGMVSLHHHPHILSTPSKPLPRQECNTVGGMTRPRFDVTHGAGYQNPMVIKYSYGKHCPGFQAGEDVEANISYLEVLKCPDRTDCEKVNGDAILMSGYLCHPCIPNACAYKQQGCMDLMPYSGKPGFECTSDVIMAKKRLFHMKPASAVHAHSNKLTVANTTNTPALLNPVDVKFHPKTASPQLWIANRGKNHTLVLKEPGTAQMSSLIWQDRAEYHYQGRVSALGFDNHGLTMISCQNIDNNYYGMHTANYFMGPTIYEVFPVGNLYGTPGKSATSVTSEGARCEKPGFPNCFLTHSDMLHESPLCMGTVHDPGANTAGGFHAGSTQSGHVYFYSDGLHGELMRFDAESLHGPGKLDHRTANIRRYIDVRLKAVQDVPGHMVLDNTTRILYVADPGNSRVLRMAADGSEFKRGAQCVPDACYPSHAAYTEGNCKDAYCSGGPCMHEDGYGCYHTFTETADVFEYELWGCSTQDDFVKSVQLPSGLALGNNRLYVGDYASGIIHVFDLSGKEQGHLPVSQMGLAGLDLQCTDAATCSLYFANSITNEIGVVSIPKEQATATPKPLPRRTCGLAGNLTRPAFNVTHGPGYQSAMVIKHSYGKNCTGFEPGEDVEETGNLTTVDVFRCPDRTDCESVNGDAILMAGYLCHPCIPNPCKSQALAHCVDLYSHNCKPGFRCVTAAAKANHSLPFCGTAAGPNKTNNRTTARADVWPPRNGSSESSPSHSLHIANLVCCFVLVLSGTVV